MSLQVADPLGSGMFGDNEEVAVAMGEPDFDFAGQTTPAASGGEIQVRLVVEITVL